MKCPNCQFENLADSLFCEDCSTQSRSALEGERKQVTVLFADVKVSMELAEQLDPETWHRFLERFFAILDRIMALFDAPIAHEDHAQRAFYAALRMREVLASAMRIDSCATSSPAACC